MRFICNVTARPIRVEMARARARKNFRTTATAVNETSRVSWQKGGGGETTRKDKSGGKFRASTGDKAPGVVLERREGGGGGGGGG